MGAVEANGVLSEGVRTGFLANTEAEITICFVSKIPPLSSAGIDRGEAVGRGGGEGIGGTDAALPPPPDLCVFVAMGCRRARARRLPSAFTGVLSLSPDRWDGGGVLSQRLLMQMARGASRGPMQYGVTNAGVASIVYRLSMITQTR